MPGAIVTRAIYVSDADVEMSKDVESLRIDRHLVTDLSSILPGRRRKMVDRIEEHGRKVPLSIVPILLRHYNDDNSKVREQVKTTIARLTQSEHGELAMVECLFSRDPLISDTAAKLLEERNFNSVNFIDTFRQAKNLVVQARKAEVFCQDVEDLMADSIETYKEGRFDQAMTNMMMAKDLLEDRLEWHGHLRGYIKDVLKLTPMLGRSGVQVDSIQDSIRNLSSALQSREYSDATSLLALRRQETRLWKQLWSLEEYITKRIKAKPIVELMVLKDSDRNLLDNFVRVARKVDDNIQDGRPADALRTVEDFIRNDISASYLMNNGKRLDAKDEAAWYTMWATGLGLLKMISPVIPNVAEEFYQQYFRDWEGAPSIHAVDWPEPFAVLGNPKEEPRPTPSKKGGRKKKGSSQPSDGA
ncbi:MAG: class I tRNA ligase family protein [Thermoplasmata archaeon]|nr:class I tRNA ligase family protein [Thermoplasmata archaeon]